ncbi:hypothetical protein GCM10020229_18530 [Kitasatospora albolonga]
MEAAVATGSFAMPVKLPAPSFGTAAQAVPNGASAAIAVLPDDDDAELDGVVEDLTAESESLPQAVRPNIRVPTASRAATEVRRELVRMDMVLAPWFIVMGRWMAWGCRPADSPSGRAAAAAGIFR